MGPSMKSLFWCLAAGLGLANEAGDDVGCLLQKAHNGASSLNPLTWSPLKPNPDLLEWVVTWYRCSDNHQSACENFVDEATKRKLIASGGLSEDDFLTLKSGYLKVPLDYDDTRPSNKIILELRVSMLMSAQAGPHAPIMLQHNGGPGSDDSEVMIETCNEFIDRIEPAATQVGEYIVLGIQQRGVSTEPITAEAFPHIFPEVKTMEITKMCDGTEMDPPLGQASYSLRDFTSCECMLPEEGFPLPSWPYPDLENEDQVSEWFEFIASRERNCYHSPYWQMKYENFTYNYLDFVGTQIFAQDLDRLRTALGRELMSIHGYSYGTQIGSIYAASFPQHIDKLLLNGCVEPGLDTGDNYEMEAVASRLAMSKLVEICLNTRTMGQDELTDPAVQALKEVCQEQGFDPSHFFYDVLAKIEAYPDSYCVRTKWGCFPITLPMVYSYMNKHVGGVENVPMWQRALHLVYKLSGQAGEPALDEAIVEVLNESCAIETVYDYNFCRRGFSSGAEETSIIRGADYSGRYTPVGALGWFRKLKSQYGGVRASGQVVVWDSRGMSFAAWLAGLEMQLANDNGASMLLWPGQPTPASFGHRAGVKALIVNSLYDRATPFPAAQRMRAAFPDGALMTWQGTGHCVKASKFDPEGTKSCIDRMASYLKDGTLPTDGFTCHQTRKITVGSEPVVLDP